jgi:hypothetical protein
MNAQTATDLLQDTIELVRRSPVPAAQILRSAGQSQRWWHHVCTGRTRSPGIHRVLAVRAAAQAVQDSAA